MRAIPFVLLGLGFSLAAACGTSEQGTGSNGDASTDDASSASDSPVATDSSPGHDSSTGTDSGAGQDSSSTQDSSSSSDSATSDGSSSDSASMDSSVADTGSVTDTGTTPDSSTCGTCATGFSCGAGGYCITASGIPQFDHVTLIVMENHSLASIQGDANATYLNGTLLTTYAYATNYSTANHPSLPNYIDLTSGSPQAIGCDCNPGTPTSGTACNGFSCNLLAANCTCGGITATHIGDQLDSAGIAWRNYGESMGTACNMANPGANSYAAKHVPFLYYADVGGNAATCANRVVDYSNFAADLNAGTIRYSFIAPDLCNDMHDTCAPTNEPIQQGDTWLHTNVPPIIAKQLGTDVLFIVWDEQDTFGSTSVPLIVVSPIMKKGPTATAYTHESLLATIEVGMGLSRLGGASTAPLIADVWK